MHAANEKHPVTKKIGTLLGFAPFKTTILE